MERSGWMAVKQRHLALVEAPGDPWSSRLGWCRAKDPWLPGEGAGPVCPTVTTVTGSAGVCAVRMDTTGQAITVCMTARTHTTGGEYPSWDRASTAWAGTATVKPTLKPRSVRTNF